MRWITSQIGAREHYAIPRVLYRAGKLERLYTDFWASTPWRLLGKLAGKSSLATRYHSDLAGASVTAFNLQALKFERREYANPYEGFLQIGEAFGRRVVRDLTSRVERRESSAKNLADSKALVPRLTPQPPGCSGALRATIGSLPRHFRAAWFSSLVGPSTAALDTRHSTLDPNTIFFGYDTGFLEPAQWIKARGGRAIVCQMDPARYEVELVKEEEKRWPGWASHSVEVPEVYYARREEEWAVADLVMVNSEWTKQALLKQGVSESKLVVVPLAYEAPGAPAVESRASRVESSFLDNPSHRTALLSTPRPSSLVPRRTLRVLFLGQVILRKGIQYLIEAARMLEKESIRFDVVGPIGISEDALKSAPSNMTFHGPVSRDRTEKFYREADLFVLPTLSDGFALTQLEAMAHDLPVIATPNCGEVVSDGVDGLIVPACDPNALAEAFQLLIQDPEKLQAMSQATQAKLEQFSLARLGRELVELEKKLKVGAISPPSPSSQEWG